MDFVYFFDSDGNATMAQFLNQVGVEETGELVWTYNVTDLSDIFEELDLSSEAASDDEDDSDEEDDDDLDPDDEIELAEVHPIIKRDLCLAAFPGGSVADCLNELEEDEEDQRRSLRKCRRVCRRLKKIGKKLKKIGKKIGREIKQTLQVTDPIWLIRGLIRGRTLEKTFKFLDIDKGARLTTSSNSLDIGVHFDASARARVRITISFKRKKNQASFKVFGGFGVAGYVRLAGTAEKKYKPEPLEIFKKSKRKVIPVGVVPVLITNRPVLTAYVEAAAVAEAGAFASMQYGYDFSIEFSYDRNRSNKFQRTRSFKKRPPLPQDPLFNLRLNAAAEVGVSFSWDLLVYELLQGSIALDLGFRSELEIGTNVEAMAVTDPYFYTLDKFKVDLFLRVRALVGVNNELRQIVNKVIDFIDDASIAFRKRSSFRLPDVSELKSATNDLPSPLQQALEIAKAESLLSDATSISVDQLNKLVPDPDNRVRQALRGLDLDFGKKSWTLFEADILLLGIPEISMSIAPGYPKTCQGDDAVVFKVKTSLDKALIPFRTGLKEGSWYANFDGRVLKENTPWRLDPERSNTEEITMRLPKSALSGSSSSYKIRPSSAIYLRATPAIMPLPPYSMFAKKKLLRLTRFDSCDDPDCEDDFSLLCCRDSDCDGDDFCDENNRCKTPVIII